MFAFTREQLRAFAPVAKAEILDALVAGADEIAAARIDTPERFHLFMAMIAVETGGLKQLEENLSYTAERLRQVWPSRFPTLAAAKPYARNPKKLAEKVYGGRMGNTKPGDGYAFRGSGLLQTTGRANFEAAGYAANPEVLRTPAGALTSALKFWTDNGCNAYCDRGDLTGLRKRINGGLNGLAEARNYHAKAQRSFKGAPRAEMALKSAAEPSQGKVRALQAQLIKIGYAGVGEPNGHLGPMTVGAISTFQAENGLDVTGTFDEATEAHLYEAAPRDVVRASAKPQGSRILGHASTLKTGAGSLLGLMGVSASADPLSQIEAVKVYVDRAKAVLSPFTAASEWATSHWMILTAVAAGAVLLIGRKIEQARLDDHASGASA